MRRTRTGFFNKEQKFKKGVSNLKEFEGEDFKYASRNKFLKQQQCQWVMEQSQQNDNKKQLIKQEKQAYDQTIIELDLKQQQEDKESAEYKRKQRIILKELYQNQMHQKQMKAVIQKERQIQEEREENARLLAEGQPQEFP